MHSVTGWPHRNQVHTHKWTNKKKQKKTKSITSIVHICAFPNANNIWHEWIMTLQLRKEQANIELQDMATNEKAINQIRFPVEWCLGSNNLVIMLSFSEVVSTCVLTHWRKQMIKAVLRVGTSLVEEFFSVHCLQHGESKQMSRPLPSMCLFQCFIDSSFLVFTNKISPSLNSVD